MRLRARKDLSLGVAFVVFLMVLGFFTSPSKADTGASDGSIRLVSVYDGGQKKVVRTSGSTVRSVLNDMGLEIEAGDKVEPGLDEEITSSGFQVNIYRSRPVLVVDGLNRTKVVTAAQTSEEVIEAAGLVLVDEDKAELRLTGGGFVESGISAELVVVRSKLVKLKFYGKEMEIRTQATTVGELLEEKQIGAAGDHVSVAAHTQVADGMELEIWRNGKNLITKEEEVGFSVIQTKDYDHAIGYRQVKVEGKKGLRAATYEIEMKNGKEVSRKLVSAVTIREARAQQEIVGAKRDLPPSMGECEKWVKQAGVTERDLPYAMELIFRESNCRVGAVNPTSGAYGIPQALPGNKMASVGADWKTNPVTQIRWMQGYVVGRYGGWRQALEFHDRNHWY